MNPDYTDAVGTKFHADGSARTFAGNTIITFVPTNAPVFREAGVIQEEVGELPFAHKFGFLPPSSFHMTVFDLLTDQTRRPKQWSSHLALDVPLKEADHFVIEQVARVAPPPQIEMRFATIGLHDNLTLYLEPATPAMAHTLRTYRDQIADVTGVRMPDHDSYRYHITLAYRLIHLLPQEREVYTAFVHARQQTLQETLGIIQLPAPILTFFDDMFRFVPEADLSLLKTRRQPFDSTGD